MEWSLNLTKMSSVSRVEDDFFFVFAQLAQELGLSVSEFDENSRFSMTRARQLQLYRP